MVDSCVLNLDVEPDALLVIWKNVSVRYLVVGSQRTNVRVACPGDRYSEVVQREDHGDLSRTLCFIQHSNVGAIRVPDEYGWRPGARIAQPLEFPNRILQAVDARAQL